MDVPVPDPRYLGMDEKGSFSFLLIAYVHHQHHYRDLVGPVKWATEVTELCGKNNRLMTHEGNAYPWCMAVSHYYWSYWSIYCHCDLLLLHASLLRRQRSHFTSSPLDILNTHVQQTMLTTSRMKPESEDQKTAPVILVITPFYTFPYRRAALNCVAKLEKLNELTLFPLMDVLSWHRPRSHNCCCCFCCQQETVRVGEKHSLQLFETFALKGFSCGRLAPRFFLSWLKYSTPPACLNDWLTTIQWLPSLWEYLCGLVTK